MNEKYLKKLIRLVEESEIESLEVSNWGRKVKITQRLASSNGNSPGPTVIETVATPRSNTVSTSDVASPQKEEAKTVVDSNLIPVTAPMVGTYYAAPSPEADPYVSVNQKITAGQVVCIVEAMKLMNEIESEISGRVVQVLVENAQPVEYGQTLFMIDPNG
jgi:acetyl-CoA carboxylase biotin carboxyl carrier protein